MGDISLASGGKFLAKNHLADDSVIGPVTKAINKFLGQVVSVDVKRLSGIWAGYYRGPVGQDQNYLFLRS